MKKKVLMLITVAMLTFAMSACGNESTKDNEVVNSTMESSTTNTESAVDTTATTENAETTEPTVTEAPTPEPTETPEPTPTAPVEIDVSSVVRTDLENYRWEMLEITYGYMLGLYEDDIEAKEELATYQQMSQEERIMYVVTDLDKLAVALNSEITNAFVASGYIEMLTESLEPALYEVRTENSLELIYGEDAEKAEKAMFDIVCSYNLGYDNDKSFVKSYPTGEYTVKVLVERSTGKVYPYEFVVQTKDVAAPNECREWSETGPWFIDYINRYFKGDYEVTYYQ